MCFLDAAYLNEPTKRRPTTGFSFKFYGCTVVYRSKTKLINALSPTESDLIDAVTDANTAKFLRSIIWSLGFTHDSPTLIYEYNDPTIGMVNSSISTERTRHIYVMLFDTQGYKEAGDIIINHVPSIINPADDINKLLVWVLNFSHARYIIGY